MLLLGVVLFVVLTFVAALIAGVGALTAIIVAAVMPVALFVFHRRPGGRDILS
jgi:hypothetical protein